MTPTSTADRAAFKPGDRVREALERARSAFHLAMLEEQDFGRFQRFKSERDAAHDALAEPAPPAPVAGEAGAREGWHLLDSLDAAYAAAMSPHATEPAGRAMIVAHLRDALLALRAAPAPAPEIGEAMVERAARAICEASGSRPDGKIALIRLRAPYLNWELWVPHASAALSAALAGAERASGKEGA